MPLFFLHPTFLSLFPKLAQSLFMENSACVSKSTTKAPMCSPLLPRVLKLYPQSRNDTVFPPQKWSLNIKKEDQRYDVCAPPVRRPSIKASSATAPFFFSTSTLLSYSPKGSGVHLMAAVPLLPKISHWACDESRTPPLLPKLYIGEEWRLRLLLSNCNQMHFMSLLSKIDATHWHDQHFSSRSTMGARKESLPAEHDHEPREARL